MVELRSAFQHLGNAQHALLVKSAADNLQAERQAVADSPAGTEIAGNPARFAGTVNTSFRYIAIGSLLFSPMERPPRARSAPGWQSTFSKASANSCAISARTRCAFR